MESANNGIKFIYGKETDLYLLKHFFTQVVF
jgi:hypothetical protein